MNLLTIPIGGGAPVGCRYELAVLLPLLKVFEHSNDNLYVVFQLRYIILQSYDRFLIC